MMPAGMEGTVLQTQSVVDQLNTSVGARDMEWAGRGLETVAAIISVSAIQ